LAILGDFLASKYLHRVLYLWDEPCFRFLFSDFDFHRYIVNILWTRVYGVDLFLTAAKKLNPLPGLAQWLPITAKLNLFDRGNLPYLIKTALLTRLAVGAVRVLENRPSKQTDPNLTPNQKRQALVERGFVEIVGTSVYMVALHLGQDLFSKVYENAKSLDLEPLLLKNAGALHLSPEKINAIDKGITEVFGKHSKSGETVLDSRGLISRHMFGERSKQYGEVVKADLATLREKLGDDLFQAAKTANPKIEAFAMRLGRSSTWSIAAGVALSALVGGWMTQRINDNIVAPKARRWLNRHFSNTTGTPPSLPSQQVAPPGTPVRFAQAETRKTFVSPGPGMPVSSAASAPNPLSAYQPGLSGQPGIAAPSPFYAPAFRGGRGIGRGIVC
jgi:hypothetical protein